jgi:Leucine-rich repeat (LRR) protein
VHRTNGIQVAKLPVAELNALQDLYESTEGAKWLWRPRVDGAVWNFSGDPNPCVDKWQGLECTPASPEPFRYVVSLDLSYYNMYGSIPASISNLTQLILLDLSSNRLDGSIPPEICAGMRVLQVFDLSENNLHGSIPECMSTMWTLTYLVLSHNSFPGTLPDFLGNLTRLIELDLGAGHFTGTIPEYFGDLTSLVRLELYQNKLTSTIPASLSQLQDLLLIDLTVNRLTGTIPASLCSNILMEYLLIPGNLFTGTVPSCISNWHALNTLSIYDNDIDGKLPDVFSQLPQLELLLAHDNHLYGTVPTDFHAKLAVLILSSNYYTGTLPLTLGGLQNLSLLSLGTNLLTSTIPVALGNASALEQIYLNNNMFTGTIPRQLSALNSLLEVQFQANRLTGHLHGLFNASNHLKVAFLFDNQFTGTLPSEIALLPKLSTFVASSNCFTGTIADAVCNSTSLVVLVLDGLLSATNCRLPLLPALHSYRVAGNAHGTVPACLFQMKRLSTLHMSGNGLTGTLPGNSTAISETLVDVILSHNQLTGTLPTHFQRHPWITLDVSYNRLTGELDKNFYVASEIATTSDNQTSNSTEENYAFLNNRLSGKVPASLLPLVNVSTLGSNIFSCASDKHDLPRGDPDFSTYECASLSFDYPYYAFIGALTLGAVVLVALMYLPSNRLSGLEAAALSVRTTLADWSLDKETDLVNLHHVLANGDLLCKIATRCTALILVVLVPWYAVASFRYGTYTHMYAWVLSAAFLSGLTPTLVEFFLYAALMIFVAVTATQLLVRQDQQLSRFSSNSSARVGSAASIAFEEAQVPYGYRVFAYATFLSINGLAVVGANLAFVGIVLTQGSGVRFLAQVALSAFKLFWNTTCLPSLIRKTARYISQSRSGSGFVTVQVLIALFNNIVVPRMVVAVLSPSCFYSALDPPAPVGSTFVYDTTVLTEITAKAAAYVAYSPPFNYDYQCSSSLITYYAAAFVYLAIAATFTSPAVKVALIFLYQDSTPGTRWRSLLQYLMPTLLLPHENGADPADRTYISAKTYIVSLTTYLGILLTFGVVFPPLAVAMCVTMLSVAWQTKLEVGRFLFSARAAGAAVLLSAIENNCRGAISVARLRNNLYIIVSGSSVFYALFLFDTLGDAVGLKGALWTLIVPPLIPVCLYVMSSLHARFLVREGVDADAALVQANGMLQLQDLGKLPETNKMDQKGEQEGTGVVFNAMIVTEPIA